MLLPALLTGVVAVVVLVLVRLVARRAAEPVWVLASGTVPAADEWVQPAIRDTARDIKGGGSWAADESDGSLRGHRGELVTLDQEVGVVASMQPHPLSAEVPRNRPVRVRLELSQYPLRTGLWRLVLGRTPAPAALELRHQLQLSLQRHAREAGAHAALTSRAPAKPVAVAGLLVVLVAAVLLLGPPLAARLTADPPAPARPQPPTSAVVCSAGGKATAPPTRSAAPAKGQCRLAERTRAAYLGTKKRPERVKLRVADPATKKRYDLTCSGTDLVTCSSGKLRLYLFTPN